jgi:phosphatidylglycerol:prolipoprotein diacylglycerol transferase
MIQYPQIDPIAVHIGPLAIRWYGLMYLVGISLGWWLLHRRCRDKAFGFSTEEVSDLIFYAALGVVIGGRLGYVLFYDTALIWRAPVEILKIWQGGMSFHGGFLGVLVACGLFCRKYHKAFMATMDFIAPVVPIGLAFGRLGNFINGELWGRVTNVPWGMIFPTGGPFIRHPSQLYEFLLEGVALFIVLWWYSSRKPPRMAVSALFLLGYGTARIFCEFFRMPDVQIGFIAFHWLTMGQLLSFPMIILGIILWVYAHRQKS